jgi:putative acetyltransferase
MEPSRPVAISVRQSTPEAISHLIALSIALQESLYPTESIHQVTPEDLASPPNLLLAAFAEKTQEPHKALGCVGLLVHEPGTVEIKSLFVEAQERGHGVATALMDSLERLARDQGVGILRLETGIYQPESLGLYRARGYVTIGPFGHYSADPLSVFMEKRLRE